MINDVKILFIKFCLYSFTKSSTHFLEITNTFFEIFFREFRPIFINEHNLTIKKTAQDIFDDLFDDKNRYYMYEDFIGEQFIWIEKHKINI